MDITRGDLYRDEMPDQIKLELWDWDDPEIYWWSERRPTIESALQSLYRDALNDVWQRCLRIEKRNKRAEDSE